MSSLIATRKAYGQALLNLGKVNSEIVVLDAEMSNSTYSELFAKEFPDRYLEMFIAEQNMISVATGLAIRGKIPFCSTFAAFLSRCFDQLRMSQYSDTNLKICGSHCGVSIGADGPSQMGLEDIAMFRTIQDSTIFYPSDNVSTQALVKIMAKNHGLFYIRTTREDTASLYGLDEEFVIGGSKTLKISDNDQVTVIGCGITLHQALKTYEKLQTENINVRIIDLYSIKPLDIETIVKASKDTGKIIVVEDHHLEGGIYEAVCSSLCHYLSQNPDFKFPLIQSLAVTKTPRSGTPAQLLEYMQIDSSSIVKSVKSFFK